MSRLEDEAAALEKALGLGLCNVADVTDWADQQILRVESPSGLLCDISLSTHRKTAEVSDLLRQFSEKADERRVSQLLVMLFKYRLNKSPASADVIARALFHMALADQIDESPLKSFGFWAWDALELADYGVTEESRSAVIAKMADTLEDAIAETSVAWSVTVFGDGAA
jgi:hypothetical protein